MCPIGLDGASVVVQLQISVKTVLRIAQADHEWSSLSLSLSLWLLNKQETNPYLRDSTLVEYHRGFLILVILGMPTFGLFSSCVAQSRIMHILLARIPQLFRVGHTRVRNPRESIDDLEQRAMLTPYLFVSGISLLS